MDATDLRRTRPTELPSALTAIHRTCEPGDKVRTWLPPAAELNRGLLDDLLTGAGFEMARRESRRTSLLRRAWTLPDTLSSRMRLLVCGLNPSPAAADAGIGFARPGNRFWPAAIAAGVVTRDRDPDHALDEHGVGMTDLVKRTTRRADELSAEEYAAGLSRLERLAKWLAPTSICFVGLAGWRVAVDRTARPGWQETALGNSRVYIMPSTSGLNASSQLPDLTAHLREAAAPTE